MYIISHVNLRGIREYSACNDCNDVYDILLGITNDEEYAKAAYYDVLNLQFDQVLLAPHDIDRLLNRVLLYGNERQTELDLSKKMILIWCLRDKDYHQFVEGRCR